MLNRFKPVLAVLRPHQWVKNLLVFVPLVASHATALEVWSRAAIAFAAFSLAASSVYLFNDWLDVDADRAHPTKKNRPLASGTLAPAAGWGLMALLVGGAFWVSLALSGPFGLVLAGYMGLNLAYTLRLKKIAVLDVVVLATFYSIRMVAGAEAASIELSHWLLAFSMFFFFGLAMVKRYTEIINSGTRHSIPNRGYQPGDGPAIMALGSASSLLSILVLTLYVNSLAVKDIYSNPERLWLLVPVLFYWVSHVWLLAYRNQIDDDPVVYAFKEKNSYGCGLMALGVIWASI